MGLVSTKELKDAVNALEEALAFSNKMTLDSVEFKIARDACIQRFKYCIELSWKTSMKLLGSNTKFAKPAVREMARADLIDSAEPWLGFIDARNDSSHSYDEDTAKRVFDQVKKFFPEVKSLLQNLQKLPS